MSGPLVSVCLPNLNTRPFLELRIASILDQSYSNWELVISDNFSEDGAWEYFQAVASREPRVSIAQAPREGMYANWNKCVERARGEYIYIATSDDVMPPNCLQKLVDALDANPDCDIAHCPLLPIDESGQELTALRDWWWSKSAFAQSSGALVRSMHVRTAPHDGLLHLLGSSVYISMTQLLIRRTLFERVGMFDARWGSVGDFNWNMRAGLVANTVHVPDTGGGWRLHASQATAAVAFKSPEFADKVDAMIDHALHSCAHSLAPEVLRPLESAWLEEASELRRYLLGLRNQAGWLAKILYAGTCVLRGSAAARSHLLLRLRGKPMSDWLTLRLSEALPGKRLLQPRR